MGGQMKKIKIVWTCSDFLHHEHRYKFTAWICGKIQILINWILSVLYWFRKKLYIKWIQVQMLKDLRSGKTVSENYIWEKLDKMLRGQNEEKKSGIK